jgi:hypothetical protein
VASANLRAGDAGLLLGVQDYTFWVGVAESSSHQPIPPPADPNASPAISVRH